MWPALVASAGAHLLAIWFLPVLTALFPAGTDISSDVELAAVGPIMVQTPERLFFTPVKPKPAAPAKPAGAEGGGGGGQGLAPGAERAGGGNRPGGSPAPGNLAAPPKRTAPKEPLRQFQFPPELKRVQSAQTIIQPAFPPDLIPPPEIALPDVLFASQEVPAPPPLREFIAPGSRRPAVERVVLEAPPVLDAPNSAPNVAALKMADAAIQDPLARLPVPPASTAPVALAETKAEGDAQFAGLEQSEGDPLNLLALNTASLPVTRMLTVFPGNQVGEGYDTIFLGEQPPGEGAGGGQETGDGSLSGGGGEGNGAPGGRGTGSGAGEGSGSGLGSGTGPGSGTGSGAGPGEGAGTGGSGFGVGSGPGGGTGLFGAGSGTGTGTGGSGSGSGGFGSGDGPGSGSGAGGGHGAGVLLARGDAATLPDPGVPLRVEHPENGVFDVVIVQSSPLEGILDQRGLLSGVPVYTVYVNVGMAPEWILQYCKPDTALPVAGPVIQLSSPAPVKAPFPRETFLPPLEMLPTGQRVIIHGFLTDRGSFRDLERVSGDLAAEHAFLTFLADWRFRPATQDGRPIEVEVLLVVPTVEPREGG